MIRAVNMQKHTQRVTLIIQHHGQQQAELLYSHKLLLVPGITPCTVISLLVNFICLWCEKNCSTPSRIPHLHQLDCMFHSHVMITCKEIQNKALHPFFMVHHKIYKLESKYMYKHSTCASLRKQIVSHAAPGMHWNIKANYFMFVVDWKKWWI